MDVLFLVALSFVVGFAIWMIISLVRLEFEHRAHQRAIMIIFETGENYNRFQHLLPSEAKGGRYRLRDIHKWTFRQFYPDLS